jgi:transcriptional regulator with XRE-family HTH domain
LKDGKNGISMTIGERIKLIRGSLSLKDFAQRIDPAKKSSYDWESGKAMPGASTLEKIHRVFGININWLLTGEGDPFLNQDNPANIKDPGMVNPLIAATSLPGSRHMPGATDPFMDAISGLREIYDSGNASLIQAIEINIRVIRQQAHREKILNDQTDQINSLENNCEKLTKEVESLKDLIETHLGGPASHNSLKAGNDS